MANAATKVPLVQPAEPLLRVTPTTIPEVLILEPRVFGDDRGFFLESYNERVFRDAGIVGRFVQDNHSRSVRNVIRGLHYQIRKPQGKLVRVVNGAVFDVAVDLRRSSPTFGRWAGTELSDQNKRILWIPPGFAHGFVVLSPTVDFLYKTTEFYEPQWDRTVLWNDPDLAIRWPIDGAPIVSAKDAAAPPFRLAEVFD
jgi:dTDP-4-dehydrorhamnose 3,5-epimerase